MTTWTGQELLKQARYVINSLGDGITMSAEEVDTDLTALNMLLSSWDAVLYANTQETKTLTASTASYSWGSGGDITTDRPIDLLDQTFIRRGTIDYPVRLIRQQEYNALADKSITGLPDRVFFDPQTTLAYLYFHPVPDAADVVYLTSLKALSEITDVTETITVPPELAAALKWNLAMEISANYNLPVTPLIQTRAMQTKTVVLNRAFKYKLVPARFANITGKSRRSNTSILSY